MKHTAWTLIVALMLAPFCWATQSSNEAAIASVAGEWEMKFDSPKVRPPNFLALEQKGEAVTGTYRNSMTSLKLAGTFTGNQLKLRGTGLVPFEFEATAEKGGLKGTFRAAGQSYTWSAQRMSK